MTGDLVQGNGALPDATGNATATATIYRAASGATRLLERHQQLVARAGAATSHGQGEPDARIQQATVNVLPTWARSPTTPAAGIQVDAVGAPVVHDDQPGRTAPRRCSRTRP